MVKLPPGILTMDKAMKISGRQAVEAAWNVYKSAGYSHYDAYFREQLKLFDDFLCDMK